MNHALNVTVCMRHADSSVMYAVHTLCLQVVLSLCSDVHSALTAYFYSPVNKALIYSTELFCSVEGTGIETRVCGCRTERKIAQCFFLNTAMLAVLGMECWAPSSTKFGQRKLLPFLIMNRRWLFFFFASYVFGIMIWISHHITSFFLSCPYLSFLLSICCFFSLPSSFSL